MGLTRAQLTQILDFTHLAADIQEGILLLEVANGDTSPSGRAMRKAARSLPWAEQRLILRE